VLKPVLALVGVLPYLVHQGINFGTLWANFHSLRECFGIPSVQKLPYWKRMKVEQQDVQMRLSAGLRNV
jgi:hypothetical protein